jgi:hypothetical protein
VSKIFLEIVGQKNYIQTKQIFSFAHVTFLDVLELAANIERAGAAT